MGGTESTRRWGGGPPAPTPLSSKGASQLSRGWKARQCISQPPSQLGSGFDMGAADQMASWKAGTAEGSEVGRRGHTLAVSVLSMWQRP